MLTSETSVNGAGLSSAPEASEKTCSSNGLRGVVKAGFRSGGAVLCGDKLVVKEVVCGGCGLNGEDPHFGGDCELVKGPCDLEGVLKTGK